jgi:alpha-tubulin suppressor-like RCC1 family protein
LAVLSFAVIAAWAATGAQAKQSSARAHVLEASRIDSGRYHTCAIDPNGDVHCWGFNFNGSLGYGNPENIGDNETPASAGVVDLGGHKATSITTGQGFTCVILDTGGVKCWGTNSSGSLGYGNTNNIGDDETPASVGTVDLGPGRTATAISAGEGHVCAILDNGSLRCWGGSNNFGQLGYGNTTPIGDNETPAAAGPVDLGPGRTAVAVATGSAYTCVILDNGSVRCWGYNGYGQTGNTGVVGDNETPGSVPPVDLGPGRTAVAISTGWSHTCVILDNGALKCWGNGERGKLGYGNTTQVTSPASLGAIDLGPGRTAVGVAASDNHTCAVLDNGAVRCWGSGEYGKLGYGNTADVGDNETPGSIAPVDLGTDRRAIAITIGKYFSCAELENGTVRCWGESFYGQLGYGNQTTIGDNEAPSLAGPVDLGSPHGALETAAGGNHSCALFDTGTVRCWGLNSSGQLGIGSTENIGDNENPGAGGTVNLGGHSAVEIAAGEAHTCALLDDGTVRCWGKGASGQLGLGNTENIGDNEAVDSVAPVNLAGESAIAIAAGANHSCALMASGTVRCWGAGASGQLGYASTVNIGDDETPDAVLPVALGRNATAITAGANHTCARVDDGTLRCWGVGLNGRLGYANTNTIGDNEAPSAAGAISVGRSAVSVTAGNSHTCARLDDSTLRCWGLGTNGRLGYSNTTTIGDNELPSSTGAVNVGGSATAIAAGGSHTCARLYNGSVRCWGLATSGQLGYANTTAIGDNEAPSLAGPVDLGAGLTAVDISAGANHNCAVLDNGAVRCWGLNSSGQLGIGNTNNIGDDETPGSVGSLDFEDDLPVAVNDTATIGEDAGATAVDVLANDTDPDGGPKAVASKTNGAHGTVAITGGGSGLTYAPAANYCGLDSFTYTLNGGSTATVSVTVTCVDDPPSAVNDSVTLNEDAAATAVGVLTNDTDSDGGPKTVATKTDGAHGTVAITGGGSGLTYAPAANYCGPDSFTYTLNGGSTATVSVTVSCVDDPPVAADDSVTLDEDASATAVDVLANDADVDGGPKSVASKANGAHGVVAITGGGTGLTYLPDPDYCGPDSFTYELNGGATATVSVTVACFDDLPSAVDDSATLNEDASATAVDVLANDADVDGGPKTVETKTNGSHGSVAITGGGTGLSYLPDPGYCGPDAFTYTLNGGSTATVSVTVTCVDDPPSAVNDSVTLNEDAAATAVGVLANDTDSDGGPKSIGAKTDGSHGDVSITGGGSGLSYTPDPHYCGPDAFTYTLNGGSQATVSVTITCVDDAPLAVNDSDTVEEDSSLTAIDVLANDTDSDGGPKSVIGRTNGAHGTVTIFGAGAGLTYAPAANYCGPDTFTYTLNGGSTATVSITVTCVEDPPPPDQGTGGQASTQTIIQPAPTPTSSAPVVNITPGIGVVSGRRHPRVAVKGAFAFFTLTCKLADRDCKGIVTISANVPSVALGPTMRAVTVVKGRFRVGSGRSVLVRAKLTRTGMKVLKKKRSLRGVAARMAIVDSGNGEKGRIEVNLVRRPKASLLPGAK